jgi:UDP-GalNAc:undecaprenyl-phosphate GalNAc-1-phosphate transferase
LHVASFDISHLAYSPTQWIYARTKCILDIIIVVLTLPITLILGLVTAAYIYLRNGGPVIYVQHRRGHRGRLFRMYKLRTMYKAKAGARPMWGIPGLFQAALQCENIGSTNCRSSTTF